MDPLFWELHSDLRHEAPGSEADTLRALAMTGLSGRLSILDAGSGPGAASVSSSGCASDDGGSTADSLEQDLHKLSLAVTEQALE